MQNAIVSYNLKDDAGQSGLGGISGYGRTGILVGSLGAAHRRIIGSDLELAEWVFSSMWRDVLIFNEMGIPAITYGPPRS